MNRKSVFSSIERLRIYEDALSTLEKDSEKEPKAVCGLISLAVQHIIPIEYSWHYEIEWDFPELWELRPVDVEPQQTGKIWWPFTVEGFHQRIKALETSIINVKKLIT